MVHGGAGAEKSTVIKILAQWMQKILQKEGDNVDYPCVDAIISRADISNYSVTSVTVFY